MRGKGHWDLNTWKKSRITPAYAGKRSSQRHIFKFFRDHPRLCGEKWKYRIFLRYYKGSPPPMRGKGPFCGSKAEYEGITPAYAGKRLPDTERGRATRDHPRLCGEKPAMHRFTVTHGGSPPPMRGKGCKLYVWEFRAGITPAYAGKSPTQPHNAVLTGDHPRLCGEKGSIGGDAGKGQGSPPPMRGKVSNQSVPLFKPQDHPRLCGEKFRLKTQIQHIQGSPPPMRGKGK